MQSIFRVSVKLAKGKSQLGESFVTAPFKLMVLPNASSYLQLMQMSSSPGLLAGDSWKTYVHLQEHTHVQLMTQAFTRVQSMHEGQWAEQETEFVLEKNSRFIYLPHPLVLHKESAFKQTTTITMQEESMLLWGEIMAAGRVLNQEKFAFRQFSSFLQITVAGRPLLRDRIQWLPQQHNLSVLGQMESFAYQGTFVYINLRQTVTEIKAVVEELQQQYREHSDVFLGFSLLDGAGFSARLLAHRADSIEAVFRHLQQFLLGR
jgi:urease accessory protein